ncbi:hypothetical protein [Rhizobium sp.]|uniref:hypothetical protein n=1 Tax=Rhizobium sp. TaxID=391 RepID=UPI003F81925E
MTTTPHDKALEAAEQELANVMHDQHYALPQDAMHRVISAYLSSIGGVVCLKEPVGAWYEDSTGCFHMSLNVALEEEKAREYGHQIHYFHEPIEAGDGDGWLPIETAPKGRPEPYGHGPEILGIMVGKGWVAYNIVRWGYHKNPARGSWRSSLSNWQPTHWRPLPPPPSISNNEGREA